MKAIVDVHYYGNIAIAGCIEFTEWKDNRPSNSITVKSKISYPYVPGKFYKRELAPILALLEKTGKEYEFLIIDGYVYLKSPLNLGLGGYLAERLSYEAAVIGVAKNYLKVADKYVEVYRGKSKKPLYVSSVNFPLNEAERLVKSMHGNNRIPTLLKQVDLLCRREIEDLKEKEVS